MTGLSLVGVLLRRVIGGAVADDVVASSALLTPLLLDQSPAQLGAAVSTGIGSEIASGGGGALVVDTLLDLVSEWYLSGLLPTNAGVALPVASMLTAAVSAVRPLRVNRSYAAAAAASAESVRLLRTMLLAGTSSAVLQIKEEEGTSNSSSSPWKMAVWGDLVMQRVVYGLTTALPSTIRALSSADLLSTSSISSFAAAAAAAVAALAVAGGTMIS